MRVFAMRRKQMHPLHFNPYKGHFFGHGNYFAGKLKEKKHRKCTWTHLLKANK